jgi:hypothetical protein
VLGVGEVSFGKLRAEIVDPGLEGFEQSNGLPISLSTVSNRLMTSFPISLDGRSISCRQSYVLGLQDHQNLSVRTLLGTALQCATTQTGTYRIWSYAQLFCGLDDGS